MITTVSTNNITTLSANNITTLSANNTVEFIYGSIPQPLNLFSWNPGCFLVSTFHFYFSSTKHNIDEYGSQYMK